MREFLQQFSSAMPQPFCSAIAQQFLQKKRPGGQISYLFVLKFLRTWRGPLDHREPRTKVLAEKSEVVNWVSVIGIGN